jgi:hypothetical protein
VLTALRARAAEISIAVTLLVPAMPARRGWTWDEGAARREARRRMHEAVASLRTNGIPVTAMVGDFSPLEAIRDEVRQRDYDEIMISTLPSPVSRWLRADLVTRVAREFSGRVTHVRPGAEPLQLVATTDRLPAA